VAHREIPLTFIDRDLLSYDSIWAAAGTPNAVFPLRASQLAGLTGGIVADVKKE
jgi:prolyl-tRNA editing enzyme YbaK/EbsC (Cys-tRNA(Pro) deacylase)